MLDCITSKTARRFIGLAALTLFAGVTLLAGQIPFQPGWKYRTGQNVVPAFEGWEKNPDGSFDMLFGYFNRNSEELIDIPAGPANNIEPGAADQGQPTFFLTGRHRFFFAVRVPKDWPVTRKLVWMLAVHGRTERASGFLLPEWEVDTPAIQGSLTAGMDPLNKAPSITIDNPTQTITLSGSATLNVSATDDGRPQRRGPTGGAARGGSTDGRGRQAGQGRGEPSAAAAGAPAPAAPIGLRVEWLQYRGPTSGRITFTPPTTPVVDGRAFTTAKFSTPGKYVVRAFVSDGAVTTPGDLTVVVNP